MSLKDFRPIAPRSGEDPSRYAYNRFRELALTFEQPTSPGGELGGTIDIVDVLPAFGNQGRVVFLTTTNKLYRDTGSGWVETVPAADIEGRLAGTQIGFDAIDTEHLADYAATEQKLKINTHLIPSVGLVVSDNSPLAGEISWSGLKIVYDGVEYSITDGSTASKYAYWVPNTSATALQTADVLPNLGADDLMVFFNNNGVATLVPNTTITHGDLLVSGSVTARAIAANTITSSEIYAGSVEADLIQGVNIAASAITTEKLNAGAVTSAKIYAGSVEADRIQAANIAAGAITTIKLNAGAVTSAKIYSGSVEANLIQAANIATGAITAGKIDVLNLSAIQADMGTLTAGVIRDLNSKFTIDLGSRLITMVDEQATPVTRVKLGELGIGAADWGIEVYDAAGALVLGATGLGVDVVDTAQIKLDAVTANEIKANTITSDEIIGTTLSAIRADLGTITAGLIQDAGATPTRGVLVSGTVPASWTTYLNLIDGTKPFLEHDKLSLNWDGSATFGGTLSAGVVSTSSLSALNADLGTITAGWLGNAAPGDAALSAAIRLTGATALPATNFIDFTATGANPWLKNGGLTLNADGTATFSGDLSAAGGSFDGVVTAQEFNAPVAHFHDGAGAGEISIGAGLTPGTATVIDEASLRLGDSSGTAGIIRRAATSYNLEFLAKNELTPALSLVLLNAGGADAYGGWDFDTTPTVNGTPLGTSENNVTGVSFSTSNGVLTLTKADTSTLTADLDGRYAQLTGGTFTGGVVIRDRLHGTNTTNAAYTNMDARAIGTTESVWHKFLRNSADTGYPAYYERWYDGDSYHSVGVSGNALTFDGSTVWHTGNASGAGNVKALTGSYGSVDITGVTGGYAGINFSTEGRVLMVDTSHQGIWDATNGWHWRFTSGALAVGSVPAARITSGTFGAGVYNWPSGSALNINGATGATTTSYKLDVAGTGRFSGLVKNTSSRRWKQNIVELAPDTDRFMQIRPVEFDWCGRGRDDHDWGLVAEQVRDVYPEMVTLDQEGMPEDLAYGAVFVKTVRVVQDHEERLRRLEAENERLRSQLSH